MTRKRFLLKLAIFLTIISCSTNDSSTAEIDDFIPSESIYMFQAPELVTMLKMMDSLEFLQKNRFIIEPSHREQLEYLARHSEGGVSLISLTGATAGGYDYTIISREENITIVTDSVVNKSIETFNYENFSIKKYKLEEAGFFTVTKNGIFLASNSRKQLETLLKENSAGVPNPFSKEYAAADASKFSLFINHRLLDTLLTQNFPGNNLPIENLATGSLLDIDIADQKVLFNGIATWQENDKVLLAAFHNVTPVQNELALITPMDAAGFYSYSYNSFEELFQNLRTGNRTLPENHFLSYTREAGMIFTPSSRALVLTATDPSLAREANTFAREEVKIYRNVEILKFTTNPKLTDYLDQLIPSMTNTYFAYLDNYILMAEDVEVLEHIITNYLNGSTLGEQEYYKDAMQNLAGASTLLMVANTENFKPRLIQLSAGKMEESSKSLDLSQYPILALQFVQERNFAHIHGIFNTTTASRRNGISQTASIEIESPIATAPALLRNHINNETEVAFQNEENILYLYSSTGEQLWKKELDARINSPLYQVDLFKNGNLQLAFSSPNSLYVLDRNGNNVKPFPLDFKDEITRPLSVFDYDNNRTYRFVITQGKDVLMYDSRGRRVKGFDFKSTGSEIVEAPKHIRIRNKDYIVIPEASGKLHILSRQGNSRVTVSENFSFSNSEWYLHENTFASVDSNDQLIRITEAAKVSREAIPNAVNPIFTATNKVRVIQSENNLRINGREVILDYGLYTKPQIFEIGKKTFIGIIDTQAQKVYLLDEEGELIPGFPVYGTSAIDLRQNAAGDRILTVKAEDNTLLLYEF
ncbi:hypothetical protein FHG64_07470 [Antarcticibacterium flavum]|uniref:Uncharacterized protein n=1 Tax=Antarcticibacterium flavum TaxID=2058175 RepID=A0A5B7X140_9FLAO|nr:MULTISPECIES: hypothetical protein [Antarcticibacterium]MCM4161034.1 hypothetical protein [Antarcticibacterium sp. W02-3]QCY69246.1 hypothetical protein FHG64_07470 [Antarcticibacterium flavum]